eukprot:6202484-Pleurochrysis_carterae.AAC.2
MALRSTRKCFVSDVPPHLGTCMNRRASFEVVASSSVTSHGMCATPAAPNLAERSDKHLERD